MYHVEQSAYPIVYTLILKALRICTVHNKVILSIDIGNGPLREGRLRWCNHPGEHLSNITRESAPMVNIHAAVFIFSRATTLIISASWPVARRRDLQVEYCFYATDLQAPFINRDGP